MTSEVAKQLSRSGPNFEGFYKTSVHNLASKQYESIDQVLDKIGEISELNMVYLMLKGSKGEGIKPTGVTTSTTTSVGGVRTTPGTASGDRRTPTGTVPGGGRAPTGTGSGGASAGQSNTLADSQEGTRVAEYIDRARRYIEKQNFASAVLELREALKLDQRNSNCHTLLGIAYLKQNQPGMAKVHLGKALQLNPKDERALKAKQYLDKLIEKSTGKKPKEPPKSEPVKPPTKPDGGGLFGGLFGGKKK